VLVSERRAKQALALPSVSKLDRRLSVREKWKILEKGNFGREQDYQKSIMATIAVIKVVFFINNPKF